MIYRHEKSTLHYDLNISANSRQHPKRGKNNQFDLLTVKQTGKSIVKPVGEVICIRKCYLPGIPIMWRHNGGFPSIHWKRRSARSERSRRHRGLASAAGRPTRPPPPACPPHATHEEQQRGRTERAREGEGPSSLISDRAYRCLPMHRRTFGLWAGFWLVRAFSHNPPPQMVTSHHWLISQAPKPKFPNVWTCGSSRTELSLLSNNYIVFPGNLGHGIGRYQHPHPPDNYSQDNSAPPPRPPKKTKKIW